VADGKGLSHFRRQNNSRLALLLGAQTSFAVPRLSTLRVDRGIPSNAQAALPKIDIRSINRTDSFYNSKVIHSVGDV
jgi:hypothetical protein